MPPSFPRTRARVTRFSSSSEERGQGDECEHERDDDLGRAKVEVVDLGAQPARQVLVLDLLQPGAVDVPDASLRDVS